MNAKVGLLVVDIGEPVDCGCFLSRMMRSSSNFIASDPKMNLGGAPSLVVVAASSGQFERFYDTSRATPSPFPRRCSLRVVARVHPNVHRQTRPESSAGTPPAKAARCASTETGSPPS